MAKDSQPYILYGTPPIGNTASSQHVENLNSKMAGYVQNPELKYTYGKMRFEFTEFISYCTMYRN